MTVNDLYQSPYISAVTSLLHPGIRKACTLGYMRRTPFLSPAQGKVPGLEAESALGESSVGSRSAIISEDVLINRAW